MRNQKVDGFIETAEQWHGEMRLIREIVLQTGLTETYKWGQPCYTHQGKNVVLIHGFKGYCALSFFKGALLKDPEGMLVQPTENSQAGRQLRFTSTDMIHQRANIILRYVQEAALLEEAGMQVEMKKTSDFEVPEELVQMFQEDVDLQVAFERLTPGRQRGYLLHFAQPKQSKTRTARIAKYVGRIKMGKGMQDCICGRSKRMPQCDGSHNR